MTLRHGVVYLAAAVGVVASLPAHYAFTGREVIHKRANREEIRA